MRADAQRNRQRIREAAHELITTRGIDVPMEQIAASAGVAVGTLYRHYPTKADLVTAILTEASGRALERLEEAVASPPPPHEAAAMLETMLADLFEQAATNHVLKAAAASLGSEHHTGEQYRRAHGALEALLARARADGDIRPSITPEDILLLVITAPSGLPAADRRRWLEIVLDGIRDRGPAR